MLGSLQDLIRKITRRTPAQTEKSVTDAPSGPSTEYKPPALSEVEKTAAKLLRQGDVAPLESIPIRGAGGTFHYRTPDGVVLLTQTCDAVRTDKLTLSVAALTRLAGDNVGLARKHKLLRYIHVPEAGDDLFADLFFTATIEKSHFLASDRRAGIDPTDDESIRVFGRAIGRRFSRFPFPDDIVPWLQPLEDVIAKRSETSGAEGKALQDVIEFRVEASGTWSGRPCNLTLCVITAIGALPSFPNNEIPPISNQLGGWLRDRNGKLRQSASKIAEELAKVRESASDQASIYWLWNALAEAWAERCRPNYDKVLPGLHEAVRAAVLDDGIDADILSEAEFTLDRYRRSEQLDLDHLSPPVPL